MTQSTAGGYGQGLQEYAVILGLVAVLGVGTMMATGNNIWTMFDNNNQQLFADGSQRNSLNSLTSLLSTSSATSFTASSTGSSSTDSGTQRFQMVINPQTGLAEIRLVPTATSGDTTAQDGKVNTHAPYVFSSIKIADTLDALAKSQTDPQAQSYIRNLANLSYRLSMAQGEIDDINEFEQLMGNYVNADALTDMLAIDRELKSLLSNPPSSLDGQLSSMIQTLGNEVALVNQRYIDGHKDMIGANGEVTQNWGNESNCVRQDLCGSGGSPGSSLTSPRYLGYNDYVQAVGSSVNDVSLNKIKQTANTLLDSGKISDEPIEVTITNADTLDKTADEAAQPPQASISITDPVNPAHTPMKVP